MTSNLLAATPDKLNWKIEELGRNVHKLYAEVERHSSFIFPLLLSSDWHWDSPHCVRDLLAKHLNEAKAAGAPVVVSGDIFCAMQGKWDKRGRKKDVRPEHNNDNYLDSLVSTLVDWLEPWKDVLALISPGNHETAVKARHETDLTARLVDRLRDRGSPVQLGGYSGWLIVGFRRINNSQSRSVKIHYHHGYGGGGPVTKGIIQTNRKSAYISDADICTGGHVHESWHINIPKVRVLESGRVLHSPQIHICTPGYKEEYGDGHEGFHIEKGRPPKPVGSYWVYVQSSRDMNFDLRAIAT